VPAGTAKGRVVMLGDSQEHFDIDPRFVTWVKTEKRLNERSVVIEWIGPNPFAHNDPGVAPVGNYMFTPIDEWVTRDQ
jgi:hypothetical protein